ncbi:MAG: glycosyltransferase family 4 protein [Actinomycetes bacterium]
MRIGLVCPYDLGAPGGVQQLVLQLAERLRGMGHETVVVGAGDPSGEGPAGAVQVGRVVRIRGNDSVAPVSLDPGVLARAREALADVDVVHVHEPLMPLVGWAGLAAGRPVVVTFHADPPSWVPRVYGMLPVRRVMRRSVITAVSRTAAAAIPASWGPVEIVPNAVDVAAFAPAGEKDSMLVAFLGRDEPRKGLDVLLDAWPAVRERHPRARLVVMGALRDTVPDGVEFLGRVGDDEKRRVLGEASVFTAPNTRGESFGIILVEAMAAGCALVASDLPAFRDVAGDAARFVPVGEAGSLAGAVSDLLADPGAARSMGESGMRRAAGFDWEAVAARYLRCYEVALGLSSLA